MPREEFTQNSASHCIDRFLVCGLGNVGQHCVHALRELGVRVSAIDREAPTNWRIPRVPQLLDELIVGDCCQAEVLQQAGIECCRTILLVTSSERANIEAAFAARLLNPDIRLVVRSAKTNLNQLLGKQLGNFVALDPSQLPATAFALAALDSDLLGLFKLDGQWLKVVQRQISLHSPWCDRRRLYEINSRTRRAIGYLPNGTAASTGFHRWDPDKILRTGDTLVYLEATGSSLDLPRMNWATDVPTPQGWRRWLSLLNWRRLSQQLNAAWRATEQKRLQRVALLCGLVVLGLLAFNTLVYRLNYPNIGWWQAFYATAILLLGDFGDLFGDLQAPNPPPGWLQFYSLTLALLGTALVGVLYGLIVEKLLGARLQFFKRRLPIPRQNHVVLIGLGRVGQRVAALLQDFKQPIVGIADTPDFDPTLLPVMPLVRGRLVEALGKVNLQTAKSVLVATGDDMVNLEIGLHARSLNPQLALVIRTYDQRWSDSLGQSLPNAQVLCGYAFAAEAFAGAAFGENILSLFRLNRETVLVTEYVIEVGDTLNGLLLAEIAYGYGVVPILYSSPRHDSRLLPFDDVRLSVGDRLVVLATSEGLRRIEYGLVDAEPKCWQVRVERALTVEAEFEGANAIARISGCPLGTARQLMAALPATLEQPLYEYQAKRLVRSLMRRQVEAQALCRN